MRRWESLHDLLRSRSATFGMALIVVVLIVAIAGPALAPYDPLKPGPSIACRARVKRTPSAPTAWGGTF